jgi:hypothetical protein
MEQILGFMNEVVSQSSLVKWKGLVPLGLATVAVSLAAWALASVVISIP